MVIFHHQCHAGLCACCIPTINFNGGAKVRQPVPNVALHFQHITMAIVRLQRWLLVRLSIGEWIMRRLDDFEQLQGPKKGFVKFKYRSAFWISQQDLAAMGRDGWPQLLDFDVKHGYTRVHWCEDGRIAFY